MMTCDSGSRDKVLHLIRVHCTFPTTRRSYHFFDRRMHAWRQKRDVWHSPNNDPKFGVRVKDVSLYEYRVGKTSAVKPAESVAAPAPAAAPAVEAEPAKSSVKRTTKVA